MSFSTKSHKKIYLHSLNTTSASYHDQNLNLYKAGFFFKFLLCRLNNTFISQITILKKETFKKSVFSPLVKVRAFEHSFCLFFIPNRAKVCYAIIVTIHNLPSYNCFWQENFPRWDFSEGKNTHKFLIRFAQWPWKRIFDKF